MEGGAEMPGMLVMNGSAALEILRRKGYNDGCGVGISGLWMAGRW